MREYFRRLFDYNRWAYARIEDHIFKYGIEHLDVIKLLSHCYNAEQIWLSRILSKKDEVAVWEIYDAKELFKRLARSNDQWLDFVESSESFDETIVYANSQGDSFVSKFIDIVAHVANHGTHHRAQVSALLRQSGTIPPKTDFIYFARD